MPGDKPAEEKKELSADGGVTPAQQSFVDNTLPTIGLDVSEQSRPTERSLVGEFIEQYKIVQILGRGGMSVVYKAVHSILGNTVAIKTMHAHLVSDQQSVMRFKQEAQAATHLDHPNIIRVTGFGITGGDTPQPYIIMDCLDGSSLSELLKQKGRLSVPSALKIFIQICNALFHAHNKGVVHRDLKPSNIMLLEKDGDSELVKLVDFGIAKVLAQEGEQAHRLTQTGEVFGSPMYMSPEQCMGRAVDRRADVYSLGCVLYEALCGKPPHQGNSVFETFHRHLTEIPASLSIPDVDKALVNRLDAIVFRALEKDPDKRYQSMAQFEDDLRLLQDSSSLPGTGLKQQLARRQRAFLRFIRSAPRTAVALFILLVVLTGAGVFCWSKVSWFVEAQHAFQTPGTRWLDYMPPRIRKRHANASEKQKMLDDGIKGLMFATLRYNGDSPVMLRMWKERAQACAELDAPAEEIEARTKITQYYERNDTDYRSDPEYAIAAEELAECLIAQGDYRAALPYLKMSVLIRDKMATAYSKMRNPRVYLELSYACTKLYRSADAETALNDAISHLSTLPEGAASSNPGMAYDGRQLSIAYALKGDLERFQAKWAASAQSYDKAEQVMKRSSFKKAGVFLNELALSRAFADLKGAHYQEASRYYEMVLPFAQEQFHGQRELQFVLDNYAYAAFHKGDWLKALTLKEQSLNLSQTVAR